MESCRCDESGPPPCAACFTVEEVRKEAALLRDVYLQRAEEIQHQKVLLAASYRRCRDACRELAVEEAAMKECMQSEGAVGLAGLRKLQLIANSQLEAARSAFLVPPVAPAPPAAPAPPPPLPPPPPPVVAEQEPLTKRIMICCCSSASAECTNRAVRLGAERGEAESHPPQVLMVQERATTIDALPDELLAAVLALVPLYRSDGSSLLELRLVSKRWKHVVRSEAVWAHRSLSISSLPRSSNMAALRLVPAIRSLRLEARLGKPLLRLRRLADTEECKISELTVSVQLHKQSADLLSETLQRRRLQLREVVFRLVLSKATSDPSPVLAALERLPELQRLTIDSDDGRKKPRVVNYQFNNFHKLHYLYLGKNLSENLVKSSIQAAKNTLREAYCLETGLDVGHDVASCPLVTTTSFQVGPGLEKIRKGQSSALETLTVICRDQYQLQQLSTFLENPEGLPCWIDVKLDLEEPDQCRALLREAGPSLRGVKTLSIKGAAGVEARELAMVLLHMADLVSLELSDSGLDMGQLVGALTALHAPALERLKFRGTGSPMRWVRDLRLLRPGLRIDVPYA